MNRRRATSLLTAVFMLHFSLAASTVPCVTDSAAPNHSSGAAAPAGAPGMATMAGMTGPDLAHDEQPCPAPSPLKCCQALTSYSVAFSNNDADAALLRNGDVRVPETASDVALTRVVAPDTPPPKP